MKNKKQIRLLLCLCCSLMLSTLPAGLTACTPKDPGPTSTGSSSVVDSFEGGVYYADVDGAEYELTIMDGVVTLTMAETMSGTYTYAQDAFTFTFADGKTATAKVENGAIVVTYEEVEYTFLEKIEYTVSFSVDGAVTSSAKVVNGRKASKPADPVKENYLFVGWYADSAFKNAYAFATPVTADTTVYARFIEMAENEYECDVTLMVDGEEFETVKTVNGVAYNLPTPTKEGTEFLGWWMSDYQDAEKLSRKYEEQKFEQNGKLFAVWKSNALAVSVDSSKISWTAADAGVGIIYTITITDPDGETATKSQGNLTYEYDFASKAAGDYVISVKDSKGAEATVYLKNKALAQVSFFKVEDGNFIFNPVANAEKYVLSVVCGDETHDHAEVDNGTSTTYNFSKCKMQKGGIKFTVKAVAEGYTESVSEEYAFSLDLEAVGEITVDDANAKASWRAVENATSYKVELFAGETLLEEKTVEATEYSLKNYTGELTIKVTPVTNSYNSPDATVKEFKKVSLAAPQNLRLDGSDVVWDKVAGASGYIIMIDGKEYPSVTTNSFTITEEIHGDLVSSTVAVKTLGAKAENASAYSDTVTIRYNEISDNLTYQNGKVMWEPVLGASRYGVKVNNGEELFTDGTATGLEVTLTKEGANTVSVRSYGRSGADAVSDWVEMTVTAFKVSFAAEGGSAVSTVYKATGDKVALPVSDRTGYTLAGWYDTPNGEDGSQYETEITVGERNMTVYAHWNSKTYKVTLVTGDKGTLEETEVEVLFGQEFKLPEAVANNPEGMFGGWYTEWNGMGTMYADQFGAGAFDWKDANNDVVLYAQWWDHVLSFVEVTLEDGTKGYAVQAGADVKFTKAVRIPATYNEKPVAQVLARAFSGCALLEKVEIPDSIQLIEVGTDGYEGAGSAFQRCSALKSVEIYEVEGNHEKVYSSQDGVLLYNNPYKGVELKFVPCGIKGAFTVPDAVEVIPTKVMYSSNYAFKITELYIPATVKVVELGAISGCNTLEKVHFLEAGGGMTPELEIGREAFSDCVKLNEFVLPSHLKYLDTMAFNGCWALMGFEVTEGGAYYSSKGGFICNGTGDTLIYASKYLAEVTIPEGVTKVAEGAFEKISDKRRSYLTKVTIPGWVQEIGARAFKDCPIEKLIIEEEGSPLTICEQAFYGADMTEVVLPARLIKLEVNAFGDTSNLKTVTLNAAGESVELQNGAFASLASQYYVTNLTIGKDVAAFEVTGVFGSAKLAYVLVEEGNNNFGSYVINEETGETDGVLYDAAISTILYFPSTKIGKYTIPDTVTAIGEGVFTNKSIESIHIGAGIAQIGKSAFANCRNLTSVTFDDGETELFIGDQAFINCTSLIELDLPLRTREIGASAFEGCKGITGTMVIPEGVTTLGSSAFKNCSGVTDLSLPSTLTTIAETTKTIKSISLETSTTYKVDEEFNIIGIFEGASSLATLTVDANNETFVSENGILYKKDANGNPSELMYSPMGNTGVNGVVTVPGSVTKVWGEAFRNNDLLTSIVFKESTNVTFAPNVFYDNDKLVSITLPKGLTTIEPQMFYSCAKLQKITIPNTVSSIRLRAFLDCTSLNELKFEEGNETNALVFEGAGAYGTIYNDAKREYYSYAEDALFSNCTSLKTVNIPERTTSIGVATFYGCTGLETVTLPKSLKTIGKQAFASCPNLTSVTFADDSLLETIGNGAFKDSAKLSTVDFGKDNSLETIEDYAFNNCTAITSMNLPADVTSIGGYVFANCDKLKSITVPETVTSIGKYAFQNCKAMTTAALSGTSLTIINEGAFMDCSALTAISIPTSVATIGKLAFSDCSALTNISFAEGTSSLTKIDQEAFKNSAIKSISLPEGVSTLTLGKYIFSGCRQLTSVHISSKVTAVKQVFEGCSSITNVSIDKDNTNLKTDGCIITNLGGTTIQYVVSKMDLTATNGTYEIPSTVTELGQAAFQGHAEIKKLIIPASISKMGTYAFADCINLEEVEFADAFAVKKLPNYTFTNCRSLKKISITSKANIAPEEGKEFENNLPAKVTQSGSNVFRGCSSLTNITLPASFGTMGNSMFQNSGLKSITLPSTVTKIASNAFSGCTDLAEVNMLGKVTEIGSSSFADTASLTSITLPNTASSMTIKASAFAGSALQSITIPDNVTTIDKTAFANCASLETVVIGNVVATINAQAFENCTALKNIEFKTLLLTYIQEKTFAGCTALENITIPAGVQFIGKDSSFGLAEDSSAFAGCTSLRSIALPESCVQLGANVFAGCTQLATINLGNVIAIGDNTFAGTALTKVELPQLLARDQGNAMFGTGVFAGCTELEEVVFGAAFNELMANTFDGCAKLSKVEMPSVTAIAAYAFRDCDSLTAIELPAGVTCINNYVFADCDNLETVTLMGNVSVIGTAAFENCSALKTFNFQPSLTSIGARAFMNTGLTQAKLPAVTSIGAQAFAGTGIQYYDLTGNNTFRVDGNGIVYKGTQIISVPAGYAPENGVFVIPEGYTVADGAFGGCNYITSIVIPETTTGITSGMFRGLTAVESIVIPEGVEYIGTYAFAGATSLKSITIPDTVTSIGMYAFEGTTALKELTLPAGLTSIGVCAFADSGIQSLVIPAGVTSITSVFKDAKALTSVTLPTTLTEIGESAFENCGIQTLIIPTSVTSLGELAFAGSALTEIVIPDTVTKMANRVFMNATKLTSATMSKNAVSMFTDDPNDRVNGQMSLTEGRTFLGCTSLQTVVIPEGVERIGKYSFEGCTSLTKVTLPSTLTYLDYGAFRYSGLKEINLPAKLEMVEYSSSSIEAWSAPFEGCVDLEKVDIEDGIKYLPAGLFAGCTKIKSIVIPESAVIKDGASTSVKEGVFAGWTSEQTINMKASAFDAAAWWGIVVNKYVAWYNDCNANIVWDYTETTTEDTPVETPAGDSTEA